MKTIKNILGVLLALAIMTIPYSCGDDVEYTPAEIPNSIEVYFPDSNSSKIDLSSEATSFEVTIARVKTDDAVTVPLTVTGGDGIYTIPTSVAFAQGESQSTITITYDPNVLEYDDYTEITLTIGDDTYTTFYGLSEYSFSVGIPAPWESLGMATYVDDFISAFFGISQVPYEVEIQENVLTPGLFRLINPYSPEVYPFGLNGTGTYDESQNHHLEIDARDSEGVYIRQQDTGLDWTYGNFLVWSIASYEMERNGKTLEEVKAQGDCGTYANGVITFPPSTLLCAMANYNDGEFYTANGGNWFKVVMPGVVLSDYSITIAYAGKYMGTNDQVAGIVAQINAVGEDVESVRLAVVEGTNVDTAVEAIKSGSINYVEATPQVGSVLIPFDNEPVEGRYTIVAVTYADNMAQEVSSAEFKYTPPTSETWTARYVGDYVYSKFFEGMDPGLTLYQSDSDPNRWKIENWGYGVDFIFTYDQVTGEIMVEDQEVGYVDSSLGTVYVDDLVDYTGGANYGYSYYDDDVFYFAVIYYVSNGNFDFGYETFTVTGSSAEAIQGVLSSRTSSKTTSKALINHIKRLKINELSKKEVY
ncbi:MAG: hypothetical protein LUF85_17935 [Bacteroides sp.]|nr:hypothetical protein [Bacteroides sp.]